uniref:synaptopodin-2 isoform X2 n=1 Tax=Doryrhamphus excisus TaxID=161450 RepID=UPI0025ADAE40|nr:synaptopodin-2 isoform X2 [Doryrhamphus excisus]
MNNGYSTTGDIQDVVSESEMEPEAEVPCSGSNGSQERGILESLAESDNEDAVSEAQRSFDPQSPFPKSNAECPGDSNLHNLSGSEDEGLYPEEDDIYSNESGDTATESPCMKASPTSPSSKPELQNPQSHSGQTPRSLSVCSYSLHGYASTMTPALTLTSEEPLGASNRPVNSKVESSEEGGSSEAPPAAVFFGISDEGAEQPQKWNSESEADLCRPDSHGARWTRLGQDDSQSQRQVKETKSKCKRIARLLTDAPNPQNKGALLFKKRRQRVKKYTLVSYGTGDRKFDSEDQLEEETEEISTAGYNLAATSDSEFEEEYSVYHHQQDLSLNWRSVREMEALPGTKGKGVMMFAHRRKRLEEIASQQELCNKGLHLEAMSEPGYAEPNNTYDARETYDHSDYENYTDRQVQQINQERSSVTNRTAKPFLGFQISKTDNAIPAGAFTVRMKSEPKFKVPVPIISSSHVWSPTGDIIASRDERISVPAIKTCSLPESRRKQTSRQRSDPRRENKGQSRAYMESEEDCFSLGAEACNFMQPKPIKLKNPPPVAPKPAINPKGAPWLRGPPSEPCLPSRNPGSQPSSCPVGHQNQHRWVQPQKVANCRESDQASSAIQIPATGRALVSAPSQPHLQPATNSWSKQMPRPPGLHRASSLSLPRRLSSGFKLPVSTPGPTSCLQQQQQKSLHKAAYKPPTPWEAASRSPFGLVDEAFFIQGNPSLVASHGQVADPRRSLPEPPDEWKRKVSIEPPLVNQGHCHVTSAYLTAPQRRKCTPEKTAVYGPPFRPAQTLKSASRSKII